MGCDKNPAGGTSVPKGLCLSLRPWVSTGTILGQTAQQPQIPWNQGVPPWPRCVLEGAAPVRAWPVLLEDSPLRAQAGWGHGGPTALSLRVRWQPLMCQRECGLGWQVPQGPSKEQQGMSPVPEREEATELLPAASLPSNPRSEPLGSLTGYPQGRPSPCGKPLRRMPENRWP